MTNRATVEVVKARKQERQNGISLPGTGDAVIYTNARRKLSVVETCNGAPGTTVALRVEVSTDESVVTANRPNYRIAIDVPLDETLASILALALDRAEEQAGRYDVGRGVILMAKKHGDLNDHGDVTDSNVMQDFADDEEVVINPGKGGDLNDE